MLRTTIACMYISLLTVALGCTKATTSDSIEVETHFLQACDDTTACGLGLDCVCGVCTKPCLSDNSCKGENPGATCESAGTPIGSCASPQASAVCDVQCTGDTDCKSLGTSYTCESGSCRKLDAGNCVRDGVIYPNGKVIDLGCNTCTCGDGTFLCTRMACIDAGMDSSVDSGTDAMRDSGIDAMVDSGMDAMRDSGPPPGSCLFDDTRYASGTSFMVDCNLCDCVDGVIGCTAVACFSCSPGDQDAGTGDLLWPVTPPATVCDVSASPDLTVLASIENPIVEIALDDEYVYWFATDDPSPHRTSKDSVLDSGSRWYQALSDTITGPVFDGCQMYYTQFGYPDGVEIGTNPVDSEDFTRLAYVPGVVGRSQTIAVDSAHVYFLATGGIYRVRRSGGPTVLMQSVNAPSYDGTLVDGGDRIYWLDGDGDRTTANDSIRWFAKDQSGTTGTLIAGLENVQWMADDRGQAIIIATRGTEDSLGNNNGNGRVIRVSIPAGVVTTLLSDAVVRSNFAVDDTHLYWTQGPWNPGGIYRALLDGSGSPVRVRDAMPGTSQLHVDGSQMYWVQPCANAPNLNAVVRAPKL